MLKTDASGSGLGAVLARRRDDASVRFDAYASHSLPTPEESYNITAHEKNYDITELEKKI